MRRISYMISLALLPMAIVLRAGAQETHRSGYEPKMLVYENLKNDSVLKHFHKRFKTMTQWVDNPVVIPFGSLGLSHHFAPSELPSDSLYAAKTYYDVKALDNRNGLEITGQAYGRLDSQVNFLSTDDDDAQSVYKAKVQGEIGWNWINSYFYQHKRKRQSIILENQIAQARKVRDNTETYDAWSDSLTRRWNHIIAAVMLCHVNNIDVLNEAYQIMIENDRTTPDYVLDAMNDKMELEFNLAQIYAKDKEIPQEHLIWIEPNNIDIDTIALRNEVTAFNPNTRLKKLEIEKLDNDMGLQNYLSTMRLTPFARWSTYLTSKDKFSHNADIGIRFTIPLYNDTKRKRQSMAVQKNIILDENDSYTDDVMAKSMLTVDRIKRLNKSIAVEYGHLKQLKKYLKMRQRVYAANKGRYSFIGRLLEYNQYCKSMERLYKQMRDRSLALVTLQKQTLLPDLNKVILVR